MIALIMGEPNFSLDSGYQELEEGLYTKPELKPGKKMFAPIQDIITLLGGTVIRDTGARSVTYTLDRRTLTLTADSTGARAQDRVATLSIAPEWRDGSMWVPLEEVFSLLGAYSRWDEARQRLAATFILPKDRKTEGLTLGGSITEANMTEQPAPFYASGEGRKLGEIVVAYQNDDGGWPKLDRRTNMLVPVNRAALTGVKGKSTIDNDSTTKQLTALARAYVVHRDPAFLRSFERGLDYILAAQLDNGGWQQFWPDPIGYKKRITFNDDAIANILEVLRDIAQRTPDYAFVDDARRQRAAQAYEKGVSLILRTQLTVAGKKTGWCAQYDELTLAPAMGRAFELPSISGHESVNVVRFLMSIEQPSPSVKQAIRDAMAWFEASSLKGVRRVKRDDRTLEFGVDYVLQNDPQAPLLWARFYDLQGKPLFTSRDSIPRSEFSEVSYERRVKYNWFSEAPRQLLEKDYPAWLNKHGLRH
ncbi:pectate lyase [Viridibacterium curvum]|uniref:pectate lyase n=1 Tax=Viridibacterium curvum TaxID=1101404 RepID=UPI0031EC5A87